MTGPRLMRCEIFTNSEPDRRTQTGLSNHEGIEQPVLRQAQDERYFDHTLGERSPSGLLQSQLLNKLEQLLPGLLGNLRAGAPDPGRADQAAVMQGVLADADANALLKLEEQQR